MSERKHSVGAHAELTFLEQLMVQALKRATSERDTMRAGLQAACAEKQSATEAWEVANGTIERQRIELARLNTLVTQLRSANVKLAESACIFPDDFDGDPIDVPAEARFAMGALHRVRMAVRERRTAYAFDVELPYNKGYHDGGNNALNAIEAAIGGAE